MLSRNENRSGTPVRGGIERDKITAAGFESYALQICEALFERHDVVVMTGGTGLYIKAFEEGMDPIPAIPREIHEGIINDYKSMGLEWLQQQVRLEDPAFFEVGEIKNPQRLMRALEVFRTSGNSILAYRNRKKAERGFDFVKIGLHLPKDELHHRISQRVDGMMESGLLAEVKQLYPYRHLNALQTVGYKELFDFLDDKLSFEQAVAAIKQNTRAYAKRQMTWFKKDLSYTWMPPDTDLLLRYLGETP
jgi:tRNA dimethylallyltransferase